MIPHHNYASLPNKSDKIDARKALKIHSDEIVMLVFGSIKENEKALIEKAYNYIASKNKTLLAPGWKVQRRKINYIRLREWVWKYDKWRVTLNKKRRLNLGFIKEDDAHLYMNAADFLFIPRTNELNSGNITLGCTFGLVVVGKNEADIGEILRETGNPTFEVGNDESLKKALSAALELNTQNHGEKNKRIAIKEWNLERISKQYVEVMNEAINE